MWKMGSKTWGWVGLVLMVGGTLAERPDLVGDAAATQIGNVTQGLGALVTLLFGGPLARAGTARNRATD